MHNERKEQNFIEIALLALLVTLGYFFIKIAVPLPHDIGNKMVLLQFFIIFCYSCFFIFILKIITLIIFVMYRNIVWHYIWSTNTQVSKYNGEVSEQTETEQQANLCWNEASEEL